MFAAGIGIGFEDGSFDYAGWDNIALDYTGTREMQIWVVDIENRLGLGTNKTGYSRNTSGQSPLSTVVIAQSRYDEYKS